jgi:hypothetical protein
LIIFLRERKVVIWFVVGKEENVEDEGFDVNFSHVKFMKIREIGRA